jgi:hypothetical protein
MKWLFIIPLYAMLSLWVASKWAIHFGSDSWIGLGILILGRAVLIFIVALILTIII